MQLSKANIQRIKKQEGLTLPDEALFQLPEKVLQFGTGVLLRGLPDYFIDKANRKGIFNGRIVVVKSTSSGSSDEFAQQDGLYTLCVRGIENGKKIEELIINSSISRVISAQENWDAVLDCASNPEMRLIISNTTEVGITLVQDDIRLYPPMSFPGKLLAFLHRRYTIFSGTKESGMIIIPTELIPDNGDKLRSILLEMAAMNKLGTAFIQWLQNSNHFCNSLVDRIVPGKLTGNDQYNTQKNLGYTDDLMIMAESFRLWAIESESEDVKKTLQFARADAGVVIAPSIEKFRELKLRLLNGSHSFSCGLASLAGFSTVREAMSNDHFASFVDALMSREIATAITGDQISNTEAIEFVKRTIDRFCNPFLDHQWLSIAVEYSSKMKMRNVPLLLRFYEKYNQPPQLMSLGFAAFILFMRPAKKENGIFKGSSNGRFYEIIDSNASIFASLWEKYGNDGIVDAVLKEIECWGEDLSKLPGFAAAVDANLQAFIKHGVMSVIRRLETKKTALS